LKVSKSSENLAEARYDIAESTAVNAARTANPIGNLVLILRW